MAYHRRTLAGVRLWGGHAMIIALLLIVLLIGGVGILVAGARRARDVPGSGVRRAFQYAVLYALFVTAATGVESLLSMAFGAGIPAPWQDHSYALAQALTFTFLALPLAAGVAWWTRRCHAREPREADSLLYAGYLGAAALTGLALGADRVHALVTALLIGEGVDPVAAAGAIAWGGLWAGHWLVRVPACAKAGHELLAAVIGLVLGAAGLFLLLAEALELFRGAPLLAGGPYELASAAGLLVAGGGAWLLYWPRRAARLPRSAAWHTYVLLLGVAGGLVLTLAGAGALVWRGLIQLLEDPAAVGTWTDWPAHIAAVVTGLTLWGYHRSFVAPDSAGGGVVRAVYAHVVAGIGLGAAAAAVGILVVAALEAMTPAPGSEGTSRNTLLAGLTLLLIGAPLWWRHWRRARRAGGDSRVRRVYLIVVLGICGVAALLSLIVAAVDLLRDAVGTGLTLGSLRTAKNPLGALIAALAAAGLHGPALRTDLRRSAAQPPVRRRSITLVGAEDAGLARQVREATGAHVHPLVMRAAPPWDQDAVLAAVAGEGDYVVVNDPGGLRAYAVQPAHLAPDSRDNPGPRQ